MCNAHVTIEYFATIAGLLAALLWLTAASVSFPRLPGAPAPIDPDLVRMGAEAYRLQATRSRRAAITTAVAILLIAIAMAIPCGQTYSWGAPGWLANIFQWDSGIQNWKDFLTVIAPFVTATVLVITLAVTINMTRSQKRSDNAKDFGDQFNQLMDKKKGWVDAAGVPANEIQDARHDGVRSEIKHYYAQLYALQFTEYYAFRAGYLERRIFTLWMRSRAREFAQETLRGLVSCQQGWEFWLTARHHGQIDEFTEFMDKVHRCGTDYRAVDQVIGRYGAWWQRWRWWF